MALRGLDCFSGIGGFAWGLRGYVAPVAYCEIDEYCQSVLLARMASGELRGAPIWDDITTLDGHQFAGCVDIIVAGFPCQNLSIAGRGEGLAGERSGLFYQVMRLAREIRPQFIFLENVPGIRTRGLDAVTGELAAAGYDCRWDVISAREVGAHMHRDRWFLLANAHCPRLEGFNECDGGENQRTARSGSVPGQGERPAKPCVLPVADGLSPWVAEPEPARCAFTKGRVRELTAIGNSVVPLQARVAFERLLYGV